MRIPPDKVPFTTVAITSSALGVHRQHAALCSDLLFTLHPAVTNPTSDGLNPLPALGSPS